MKSWEFWIDRGGTFTDIVALTPTGHLTTTKLLSNNPAHYPDAAAEGIARLRGADPAPIAAVRMGTTVATNALLERAGAPTLLAITRGHADALTIGHQARPDIFALEIQRPASLHAATCEIDERVSATGEILRPLDETTARKALTAHYNNGLRSIAIVLMHGWRSPAHERRLAEIAHEIGFTQVTTSHSVGAVIKLVPRGLTAVADAYLSPPLRHYVETVATGLEQLAGDTPTLLFMQSNGGLAAANHFQGRDAILSGPAGGIVGMAATGKQAGHERLIGFDMGGTSTDVSHYDGQFERADETLVAGVRVRVPMLRIDTVAAGGGSILRFDGARLRVGPESAGARPGPAAYRNDGPLTVTDCNVLLGKLQPEYFPALFGPDADHPLDTETVTAKFAALAAEMNTTSEAVAEGAISIAVETMAAAIKGISIARGHDVAGYTLACFGGAAGQHACLVADALGIKRIMVHPLAGVLSAYGIGLADVRVLREATLALPLAADIDAEIAGQTAALETAARGALIAQNLAFDEIRTETRARIRYAGSDTPLDLALASPAEMAAAFAAEQQRRFGFLTGTDDLILDSIAIEAIGISRAKTPHLPSHPRETPSQGKNHPVFTAGQSRDTPFHDRNTLPKAWSHPGPVVITDPSATTIVEPGWSVTVDGHLNLILTRDAEITVPKPSTEADPVRLEIFANRFMGIAEQMGVALQTTAWSVNIKERLDFSCALFDATGHLIANAPHMPVHLGSMGDSVRAIQSARQNDGRGILPHDAYMLNAPYNGGTHLPDVTVIMPVFVAGKLAYWTAARGHQADIGGTTPGSMPPDSRSVEEEGVLIDNVLLVDQGRLLEAETLALLSSGKYPARDPARCLGDLQAQLAACTRGANELISLGESFGHDVVAAYMAHVQDNAETAVRAAIKHLKPGNFAYEMDNGAVVKVAITIENTTATVDFTGTSAQLPHNFNAPLSVCRAAVLYVFRCLTTGDLPLNDGCMRPINLIVPTGSMLNPAYPAAVVAGNVETSQVITDALFGALGVMAAAQGTMNNFTFGNADYQYYETIAGGSGAGPGFAGTSAVQTHMTNSRLTDPEVLETRFPVVVEDFAIRLESGGKGQFNGGDGALRRIRFREPMTAGILSNRRRIAPFGLSGGDPASPGRTTVERIDGSTEILGATARTSLAAGEAIVIETPGGGGYGPQT